jgi:5-dehydro-2-deoxygluconokinase
MAISEADIPEAMIAGAGCVVLSGTHLSAPDPRAASLKAARLARAAGGRVVFDIDYRPVLWGLAARDRGEDRFIADQSVSAVLQEILPLCDLVVGTEDEFHILGGEMEIMAALAVVRGCTDAVLVVKHGRRGATAWPAGVRRGDEISHPGFLVEALNPVGAGDAFMAGFLRGWLRELGVAASLELGAAAGAIVASRHGCAPSMPTWPEVQAFLSRENRPCKLAEDAELEHIHWVTTRGPPIDELMVLAVDHRSQFEVIARDCRADPKRIGSFKGLALEAAARLATGISNFGILLDGTYGAGALARAAELPLWVGRCIEKPGSRPLVFEGSSDAGMDLVTWPARQVVKCLLRAHPEDPADLRNRQERQLQRLFDACRRTGHELMLELIPPISRATDATLIARLMDQIYALNVRPDWWKLPPSEDPRVWESIETAIARGDRLCRGVLVLGMGASADDLAVIFRSCARSPVVKGFALGRTVFDDVARSWFKGDLDDEGAIAELTDRLGALVTAWRQAKVKEPAS